MKSNIFLLFSSSFIEVALRLFLPTHYVVTGVDTIARIRVNHKNINHFGGNKSIVLTTRAIFAHARVMAQLAHELGVNEQDIIIESESVDTKDQAQIINSMIGDERFILVTSALHMPRSMALFTKLGMKPIPAPTRSIENKLLNRGPNPFFPSSINLQKAEMAFHEYLGIIWAKLRNQI